MRIPERETGGHQVVLIKVEHGAVQQLQAARIDEYLGAVRTFEHLIALPGAAIPRERVAETRTAAGLHRNAETATRLLFPGQLLRYDTSRAVRDLNHFR